MIAISENGFDVDEVIEQVWSVKYWFLILLLLYFPYNLLKAI